MKASEQWKKENEWQVTFQMPFLGSAWFHVSFTTITCYEVIWNWVFTHMMIHTGLIIDAISGTFTVTNTSGK